MRVPGTSSIRWSWIILFGSCYLFLVLLFLLRKIFSEKVEKNNEQDQKKYHEPIPPVPGFEYRNLIVINVHLKPQNTNHKSQKKVKNEK